VTRRRAAGWRKAAELLKAPADPFQDDLAEHAIASPPELYLDEDYSMYDDFDMFDYWYDIEEGSDADVEGVEGKSVVKDSSKPGQKRKRDGKVMAGRKTRRVDSSRKVQAPSVRPMSPMPTVLWISQRDRDTRRAAKVKLIDENAKSYALLKDWRERLGRSPKSKRRAVQEAEYGVDIPTDKGKKASLTAPLSTSPEPEDEEGLISGALMTAIQTRLSGAQGLEGFDQSILLQYAMRMMANEDAVDDIAGELTEEILDRPDDDPHASGIASWISQQLGTAEEDEDETNEEEASTRSPFPVLMSPAVLAPNQHPPTPSSTETATSTSTTVNLGLTVTRPGGSGPTASTNAANKQSASRGLKGKLRSHALAASDATTATQPRTRKRKADADDTESAEPAEPAPELKRPTRSYNAPTAASQARAATPAPAASKFTRSGRARRG
jgi:hypothetical protein